MDKKYVRAFYDGLVGGSDMFGVAWWMLTDDKRPIGYQAMKHSLHYDTLGDDKRKHFEPLEGPIQKINELEILLRGVGMISGISANFATVGLLGAIMLGEVYCKVKDDTQNDVRNIDR